MEQGDPLDFVMWNWLEEGRNEVKTLLENENYDTCVEASDWRWSAAVLGLIKYFNYHRLDYKEAQDAIYYNQADLTKERYVAFIEHYYGEKLHHVIIQNKLTENQFSEADIKLINEKLKANTIMKNVMKKVTFDGTNKEQILTLLNENRDEVIIETFRNKNEMYKNYCNTNALFSESNESCRLVGYNIDFAKKGKSASYNFDKVNFVYQDEREFDFIPFAFSGAREVFFINDNATIETLKKTNTTYEFLVQSLEKQEEKVNPREILFKAMMEIDDFIDYDIEIISKKQDKEFFETVYIHKQSLRILRAIKDYYDIFGFSIKVTDDYWINIQEEVLKCILNNLRTDYLIEMFLKNNENQYVVSKLIALNILIEEGGLEMEKRTKVAYACAKEVVSKLPENKLSSYRQKLTSAIVFNDFDRVCEILLQLSNYAEVSFDFAYDLFEDFDKNKDVAYSFINALNQFSKKDERK